MWSLLSYLLYRFVGLLNEPRNVYRHLFGHFINVELMVLKIRFLIDDDMNFILFRHNKIAKTSKRLQFEKNKRLEEKKKKITCQE